MFRAEIAPAMGRGCTLPPAICGASARSSRTIKAHPVRCGSARTTRASGLQRWWGAQIRARAGFFKRVIRLGIGQQLQVDDDIDVPGAGVRRHLGRPGPDKIMRCEPANEGDGVFPRSQAAQQGHQDSLAIERVRVRVALECSRLGYQNPIRLRRRCTAKSFVQPSPRRRSR